MSGIRHTVDQPGPSITDQVAAEAMTAIDEGLAARGQDKNHCFSVVMVLIPDGTPTNATVAGSLPNGDTNAKHLLSHALTQLGPLAAELGCSIRLQTERN
jgi:hypothetical protein